MRSKQTAAAQRVRAATGWRDRFVATVTHDAWCGAAASKPYARLLRAPIAALAGDWEQPTVVASRLHVELRPQEESILQRWAHHQRGLLGCMWKDDPVLAPAARVVGALGTRLVDCIVAGAGALLGALVGAARTLSPWYLFGVPLVAEGRAHDRGLVDPSFMQQLPVELKAAIIERLPDCADRASLNEVFPALREHHSWGLADKALREGRFAAQPLHSEQVLLNTAGMNRALDRRELACVSRPDGTIEPHFYAVPNTAPSSADPGHRFATKLFWEGNELQSQTQESLPRWSLTTQKLFANWPNRHRPRVNISRSPDGQWAVVTASRAALSPRKAVLVDLVEGRIVRALPNVDGFELNANQRAVHWSRDGRMLALRTNAARGASCFALTPTGPQGAAQATERPQRPGTVCALRGDGRQLAVAEGGQVEIRDVDASAGAHARIGMPGHELSMHGWSDCGRYLVISSEELGVPGSKLHVLDAQNFSIIVEYAGCGNTVDVQWLQDSSTQAFVVLRRRNDVSEHPGTQHWFVDAYRAF